MKTFEKIISHWKTIDLDTIEFGFDISIFDSKYILPAYTYGKYD